MALNFTDFITQYKPSSKTQIGIGGYLLDVRMNEEVLHEAELTEYPVETGYVLQDHIIIKPVTITIQGDVSDIHVRPTTSLFSGGLSRLNDLADTAAIYLPAKTSSQLRKIRNRANQLDSAAKGLQRQLISGASLFDLVGTNPTSNAQDFFDKLTTAYQTGQEINVSTPYKTFPRMVIISLLIATDNEATSLGYEVTFKELRVANSETAEFKISNPNTGAKVAPPFFSAAEQAGADAAAAIPLSPAELNYIERSKNSKEIIIPD